MAVTPMSQPGQDTEVTLSRSGGLACLALATPVKALVDRPRPAGTLVADTGRSMPSGHALTAAVTAVVLGFILTRPGRSRLLALAAAAAWSIPVALSRTYLSAHWLTDVAASLLLGTGWTALWLGVLAPSQRTLRPPTTLSPARDP